jgi:hypothetical protein
MKQFIDAEVAKGDQLDKKFFAQLVNLYRGCLRELGLTLQPSRATYRAIPGHAPTSDPRARWGHLLGDGG